MKALLSALSLAVASCAFGQEQLSHKPRLYQTDEGKLYINKSLPIYLWLSTSPDKNAEKVQLKSEDSKAYTNPLYLDTEGFNTVRTPSKVDTVTKKTVYPVEDIIFEIYADSEHPKNTISLDSAKLYQNKKGLFASGNVTVNISSKDALSGVDKTYISTDGTAFTEYTGSKTISDEKMHTIQYYAVDNVGNPSPTKTKTFSIDKTAPKTNLSIKGDSISGLLSGRSYIRLKASDEASGVKKIYYSFGTGKVLEYTYQISANYLREGEHTITYYAIDNVGNKEAEKIYSFFVDKTAPMVIDELQGNTYFINGKEYSSGRTKMKLTAIDNKAGVKEIYYTFDGKNYQLYDKPFYLPNNKGDINIKYYAVDNVNNKSSSSQEGKKSHLTYMDLTGPRLNFSFAGKTFRNRDTVFINRDTKIALKAADLESGVKKITYVLNNGTQQDYSEPFTCPDEGRYHIEYTGYDNVHNTNVSEFHFIVDTTGPSIYERYSIESIGAVGGTQVFPSHVVLFLSATDLDAGYSSLYYSINGAPMKLYTGVVSGFAKNKTYTVSIKAYDKLSNFKTKTITFKTGD